MKEEHKTEPAHATWFRSVQREIADDYKRLHIQAQDDPQRAGHGTEQTWARILEDWLPSSYRVLTRRYIVPEVGTKSFETDIVVLHPSYPARLARREEILSGGVAAAFNVRLTLDAAGISDGVERAVKLRQGMIRRSGTVINEMVPPFCVGVLAHSHTWKAPGSTPRENIVGQLRSLDEKLAKHPRESLDFLCVADLGLWWTTRIPLIREMLKGNNPNATGVAAGKEMAVSGIGQTIPNETYVPVASLITHMLAKLSYKDAMLEPLVTNLRSMGTLGAADGNGREWSLETVFSDIALSQLPNLLSVKGPGFWGTPMY